MMKDTIWVILAIIIAMVFILLVCIYWETIKRIFAIIGAVILWPYTFWKWKRAEKAYWQYIEEHKVEFVKELMGWVRNETVGQWSSKETTEALNNAMSDIAKTGYTIEDIKSIEIPSGER